ncbi:uncharacterized protein [Bemisia tabaci]|uniref:uncharacterized protein n=1 Tax=Bemisia tabaci TaxID=7038 RepID=UPI003B289B71
MLINANCPIFIKISNDFNNNSCSLQIEIWKIFGGVEEKEFDKLPVVFENIQIYAEINLSIEDPSEIYFGILSSGEFIVNQVIRRGEQEIEEETTLIRGKIQTWEDPKPTLSLKEEKDVAVQSLSTESLCIDGVRVQAISDLNLSSDGMLGKIRWNKDWVEYLNAIFNANLLQKMQEADAELQPTSVQFIHIHPERLEVKRAGSNIEFSIQSTLQTFESEGVSLRKMTTKLKPTEEELVEKLYFVSYGETSFVVSLTKSELYNKSLRRKQIDGHVMVTKPTVKTKNMLLSILSSLSSLYLRNR